MLDAEEILGERCGSTLTETIGCVEADQLQMS